MAETKYIPDSSGAVTIKGLESEVDRYLLEDAYIKELTSRLDEMKTKLRQQMELILSQAQPGSKSVYMLGNKGALRITPPDLEKSGNRPPISAETAKLLRKAGGLDQLGAKLDEIVESELRVTLTGEYAERFKAQLESMVEAGQLQDIPEDVAIEYKRRLKLSGMAELQALKDDDSPAGEVARVLLKKGIRAATVKGEESWR